MERQTEREKDERVIILIAWQQPEREMLGSGLNLLFLFAFSKI